MRFVLSENLLHPRILFCECGRAPGVPFLGGGVEGPRGVGGPLAGPRHRPGHGRHFAASEERDTVAAVVLYAGHFCPTYRAAERACRGRAAQQRYGYGTGVRGGESAPTGPAMLSPGRPDPRPIAGGIPADGSPSSRTRASLLSQGGIEPGPERGGLEGSRSESCVFLFECHFSFVIELILATLSALPFFKTTCICARRAAAGKRLVERWGKLSATIISQCTFEK